MVDTELLMYKLKLWNKRSDQDDPGDRGKALYFIFRFIVTITP
jgi:hypothetical protein